MTRFVAFLRGVSPLNLKMSELKTACEEIDFTDVVTVLSSGNVVFNAKKASSKTLERQIEAALQKRSKRFFPAIVKRQDDLRAFVEGDPFRESKSGAKSKLVVTFLKDSQIQKPKLPVRKNGVSIFRVEGDIVCSTYIPNPKGPFFMSLLEKTFGSAITTRTFDTVKKVAQK